MKTSEVRKKSRENEICIANVLENVDTTSFISKFCQRKYVANVSLNEQDY